MTAPMPLTESDADRFACTLDGLTATASDGRTAPLDKCCWLQIAPCGCVSGVIVAVLGTDVLMTAEQALRHMAGSATDAKTEQKRGFRMILILHEDMKAAWPTSGTCEHTPQWGYVKPSREVGGLTWQQYASDDWRCCDSEGREWRAEKYSNAWHLYPPREVETNRIPWLDSKLDSALNRAGEHIAKAASS